MDAQKAVTQRKSLLDWLMLSIADILFLRIFFNSLSAGERLLNDGDTGYHVITGETILNTFQVPYSDPYSHTLPGTPWTAHEWLAEVILAGFHKLMGLNGVVLLSAFVIAATFFFVYQFMVYRKTSPVIAAFATILAAWASSLHWLARPHIFSFPLTLAFIVILELYQREQKNYLKLLPVLMLIWVNLHGGYILGIILILIYAGGNFLISLSTSDRRDEAKKACKSLSLVALFTLLAACVNPRGPTIPLFPFHLIGRQYIMDNISEWISPNFHVLTSFEFMLLLILAIFVISPRRPDLFEGGVALLLVHMSLYSQRYIPLLSIIVVPLVANRAAAVFDLLTAPLESIKVVKETKSVVQKISANITALEARFTRHLWIYLSVIACLLIALNGGRVGKEQLMNYQHDTRKFPVEALEFARQNEIGGKMFNNDGWGGYLIYKGYPQYKVFMDGRSDMYGVEFLKEYISVARGRLGCEAVLEKYDVSWVMYNANSPICQLLAASGKWKLVYADTTANILLKDIPENRALIERYKDTAFVPTEEE